MRIPELLSSVRRAAGVGPRGIAQRIAQRAYRSTGAADLLFNLDFDDILDDIPSHAPVPERHRTRGETLTIGWVTTPPAPGSGGHTTLFRVVEALESRGHRCVIYLYDKHGLDLDKWRGVLREHWGEVRADVRDVTAGITGLDAVVATGWESAHLIMRYGRSPMRRLYFLQDYEPFFYGHGAEYELAAMTYRFPFRRIALGEMLEGMIHDETGLHSDVVPFGCDSAAYRPPSSPVPRRGIVFYSRPDFARRGYQLAVVALRRFHAKHPEHEIHVYGAAPRGIGIPVTFHGRLSPAQLNELYGRTVTGLAMSFTNITLVAEEMLAAGNIPVVNEMALAHLVLPNPHVRWAAPTAAALAEQLSAAVSADDVQGNAVAAAHSVTGRSWDPTRREIVRVIEDEVYGGALAGAAEHEREGTA